MNLLIIFISYSKNKCFHGIPTDRVGSHGHNHFTNWLRLANIIQNNATICGCCNANITLNWIELDVIDRVISPFPRFERLSPRFFPQIDALSARNQIRFLFMMIHEINRILCDYCVQWCFISVFDLQLHVAVHFKNIIVQKRQIPLLYVLIVVHREKIVAMIWNTYTSDNAIVRLDSTQTMVVGKIPNFDFSITGTWEYDWQFAWMLGQMLNRIRMTIKWTNKRFREYSIQFDCVQSSLVFTIHSKRMQRRVIISVNCSEKWNV